MTDTSVKTATNKNPAFSTQRYLRVGEVHDDTLVLKSGGLRAILDVGSVNMNLKSEEEQNALIVGYQGFLNSLEFPIQIVVRSKKLDIAKYLDTTRALAEHQRNELLRRMTLEYAEYVKRLVEFADIMEKHFYVIVPADPARVESKKTMFQKFLDFIKPADSRAAFLERKKEFAEQVKVLNSRTDTIANGLTSMGLAVRKLETTELIKLFYEIYNPATARTQHVDDVGALNLSTNIA